MYLCLRPRNSARRAVIQVAFKAAAVTIVVFTSPFKRSPTDQMQQSTSNNKEERTMHVACSPTHENKTQIDSVSCLYQRFPHRRSVVQHRLCLFPRFPRLQLIVLMPLCLVPTFSPPRFCCPTSVVSVSSIPTTAVDCFDASLFGTNVFPTARFCCPTSVVSVSRFPRLQIVLMPLLLWFSR